VKIAEVAHIFGLLFSTVNTHSFRQKRDWAIVFCGIFSQTHLVTMKNVTDVHKKTTNMSKKKYVVVIVERLQLGLMVRGLS
jgi:hypothetical protein